MTPLARVIGSSGFSWSRVMVAVLAVGVAGGCVRLGFWQLARHTERKSRNEFITARMERELMDVGGESVVDSLEFRRVRVAGVFDSSRQVVEWGRAVNGVPAVYIATPLVTSSGVAVLVERGWAASPSARAVDVARLGEPDTSVVEGVLLRLDGGTIPEDRSWPLYVRRADPSALQSLFPYPVAPLVVRRTLLPSNAPPGLGLAPLPPTTAGPHLSYAVQWFVFATIAVIGPIVASGAFTRRSVSGQAVPQRY